MDWIEWGLVVLFSVYSFNLIASFIIDWTMPTFLKGTKLKPKSKERICDVNSPGYEIIQLKQNICRFVMYLQLLGQSSHPSCYQSLPHSGKWIQCGTIWLRLLSISLLISNLILSLNSISTFQLIWEPCSSFLRLTRQDSGKTAKKVKLITAISPFKGESETEGKSFWTIFFFRADAPGDWCLNIPFNFSFFLNIVAGFPTSSGLLTGHQRHLCKGFKQIQISEIGEFLIFTL